MPSAPVCSAVSTCAATPPSDARRHPSGATVSNVPVPSRVFDFDVVLRRPPPATRRAAHRWVRVRRSEGCGRHVGCRLSPAQPEVVEVVVASTVVVVVVVVVEGTDVVVVVDVEGLVVVVAGPVVVGATVVVVELVVVL